VPNDWSESTGLTLDISFNDGVKLPKVEQVLQAIAEELNVLVERECEFRAFLVCDAFEIIVSTTLLSDGTTNNRRRTIEERVVFQVSSSELFLPSLILWVSSLFMFLMY